MSQKTNGQRRGWPKARSFVKRHRWIVALTLLLMATAMAAPKNAAKAAKMSNEDCLACHSDPTLAKDENGKQFSLHVDDGKFKASIHSSFRCTDCHTDIKAFPHDPTPAKPVCATC